MRKPKVISYLRFSSEKQSKGDSIERQMAYADRWVAENHMELDDTLTLRDEGLSAYHQKHVKKGALGAFLRAVEDGMIEPGTILLVEALDRLSRAEPIQAQAQLAQIINAGIIVVTASDNKRYSRASLKDQPMDLVYSLLLMIRANEESETKSKRVTAAILRQCRGWVDGSWRGLIRNGKDPQWVRIVEGKLELDEERARAIRMVIAMFKKGHGAVYITREIEKCGLRITNGGCDPQRVYRLLKQRALIGDKEICVGGENFRLPGYYPPILTAQEFDELQYLAATRARRKTKGDLPSILTGFGVTVCGYCGGLMFTQNMMHRNKQENGLPQNGHRRIGCLGAARNKGCEYGGTSSIVPIEGAIMNFCSDQMNLTSLFSGDDGQTERAARLFQAKKRCDMLQQQIERVMGAMLEDSNTAPRIFTEKLRELEAALAGEKTSITAIEQEMAAVAGSAPPVAEVWSLLVERVTRLDYEARIQARQLVADTFRKIVVYHRGFVPSEEDGAYIGLVLISRRGNTRMLRVYRRTGAWQAAEDFDHSAGTPLPVGVDN